MMLLRSMESVDCTLAVFIMCIGECYWRSFRSKRRDLQATGKQVSGYSVKSDRR